MKLNRLAKQIKNKDRNLSNELSFNLAFKVVVKYLKYHKVLFTAQNYINIAQLTNTLSM